MPLRVARRKRSVLSLSKRRDADQPSKARKISSTKNSLERDTAASASRCTNRYRIRDPDRNLPDWPGKSKDFPGIFSDRADPIPNYRDRSLDGSRVYGLAIED